MGNDVHRKGADTPQGDPAYAKTVCRNPFEENNIITHKVSEALKNSEKEAHQREAVRQCELWIDQTSAFLRKKGARKRLAALGISQKILSPPVLLGVGNASNLEDVLPEYERRIQLAGNDGEVRALLESAFRFYAAAQECMKEDDVPQAVMKMCSKFDEYQRKALRGNGLKRNGKGHARNGDQNGARKVSGQRRGPNYSSSHNRESSYGRKIFYAGAAFSAITLATVTAIMGLGKKDTERGGEAVASAKDHEPPIGKGIPKINIPEDESDLEAQRPEAATAAPAAPPPDPSDDTTPHAEAASPAPQPKDTEIAEPVQVAVVPSNVSDVKPDPPEPKGDEELEKARRQVAKTFANDFEEIERTTSPSSKNRKRRNLARDLMKTAQDEKNKARQLALLEKAKELGIQAVDTTATWKAIEQRAALTGADDFPDKVEALRKLLENDDDSVRKRYISQKDFMKKAIELFDQAVKEGRFNEVEGLVQDAKTAYGHYQAARGKGDKRLESELSECQEQAKEMKVVQVASEALEQDPDDPHANLTMGWYHCYVGDFAEGFPRFAKGGDPELKKLAENDDPIDSCIAWLEFLGGNPPDGIEGITEEGLRRVQEERKRQLTDLYQNLQGLEKAHAGKVLGKNGVEVEGGGKVEMRRKVGPKRVRSVETIGQYEVDLLTTINIPSQAVAGQWILTPKGLATTGQKGNGIPRIWLSKKPSPGKDFEMEFQFTRQNKSTHVSFIIPIKDKNMVLVLSCLGGKHHKLHNFNNSKQEDHSFRVAAKPIPNGVPHTCKVVVVHLKKGQIRMRVSLDEAELFDTTFSDRSMEEHIAFLLPTTTSGLSASAPTTFHSAKLRSRDRIQNVH